MHLGTLKYRVWYTPDVVQLNDVWPWIGTSRSVPGSPLQRMTLVFALQTI